MYRRLEAARIIETLEFLEHRVGAQFPGSGLGGVTSELLAVARESAARAAYLARPSLALRVGAWTLIAVIALIVVEAVLHLNLTLRWQDVAAFLQSSQAIQNVVFLGVAVLFLTTVETRIKRRRALAAIHELRSIAHIVDMHQLAKDPDQFVAGKAATAFSPGHAMTRLELSRYLHYCTDLLSITGKVAALYVQGLQDPVVLDAVNDVENLTMGLSRKIWQKIMILDTLGG